MKKRTDKKATTYGLTPALFLELAALGIFILLALIQLVIFPVLNQITSLFN